MELVEIEVGCGTSPRRPGVINCDLYPGPNVDVTFNLQREWPFADASISRVRGFHVLEHLDEPKKFFREAWRVLAPGGLVLLYLPYGPSDDGMTDITHVRYWLPGTFAFLQPSYDDVSGNPQHGTWRWPFEVQYVACRINPALRWTFVGPWRRWTLRIPWFLWNGHQEMIVSLKALKTPEAVAEFHRNGRPNMVPVAQVVGENDIEGRPLAPGEGRKFVQLNNGGLITRERKRHVPQPT